VAGTAWRKRRAHRACWSERAHTGDSTARVGLGILVPAGQHRARLQVRPGRHAQHKPGQARAGANGERARGGGWGCAPSSAAGTLARVLCGAEAFVPRFTALLDTSAALDSNIRLLVQRGRHGSAFAEETPRNSRQGPKAPKKLSKSTAVLKNPARRSWYSPGSEIFVPRPYRVRIGLTLKVVG